MSDVVQKLWGFCHTLRHDGIDYGDYIEQITYLLFLKMSDERGIDLTKVSMRGIDGKSQRINCSWPALTARSGTELTDYYANLLRGSSGDRGVMLPTGMIYQDVVGDPRQTLIWDGERVAPE